MKHGFFKRNTLWVLPIIYLIAIVFITLSLLCVSEVIKINRYFTFLIYSAALLFTVYSIVSAVVNYKAVKKLFVDMMNKNKIAKLVVNYNVRTTIFSLGSLILNLCFLAYYLALTLFSFSLWYLALTIYYLLLFLTRELTLYNRYKYPNNEKRRMATFKICGILLCLLPLYLLTSIREVALGNNVFPYPELHIYVMALITFYKIIMGTYNWFKARKTHDLVTMSLRNINLAEALASLLSLQSAMLVLFSADAPDFEFRMNLSVGIAIIIITLLVGISMIVRAYKERKWHKFSEGVYGLSKFFKE